MCEFTLVNCDAPFYSRIILNRCFDTLISNLQYEWDGSINETICGCARDNTRMLGTQ